jgi:hypothetical protein
MDKLIINPRERPYSPDIMDMQSMIGRAISDLMKFEHASALNPDSGLSSTNVCYGLAVDSNAGTGLTYVSMTTGVLMQFSTTLAPVPGTLDSKYRIGFNLNSLQIDLPNPGVATWYLLQAQVQETTTLSELRDIMDPVLGQFTPTNVSKRKEWTIKADAATWLVGSTTQIPVPSFGDWVPICAALVQPGGTIAANADFVDVRPVAHARHSLRQGWSRSARVPVLETNATPTTPANWTIKLAVDEAVTNQDAAGYGGGLKLQVSDDSATLNSIDPTSAAVIELGLTITASKWFYLYLCPWYDVAPDNNRQSAAHTRGVLVLSDKAPDAEGLFNGSALTLPAPFGNYPVPAYQAPCVGALRSNYTNNGWDVMSGGSGYFTMADNDNWNSTIFISGSTSYTIPSSRIPQNAKTITWSLSTDSASAAGFLWHEIGDAGFASGYGHGRLVQQVVTSDTHVYGLVTVPRKHSAKSLITLPGARTLTQQAGIIVGYTT